MEIKAIEQSVLLALDEEDAHVTPFYAEHCADHLGELAEQLCQAIIGTDFSAWAAVLTAAKSNAPDMAAALIAIEERITEQRTPFVAAFAQTILDATEHDAQCRAELNMRRSA